MSTPQEYWDACLIRTWRRAGTVLDVVSIFHSITGEKIHEMNPPLLRIPKIGFPWRVGVRVFTASHLSKISKRLFEQSPEKDVALLHKLKDSKYDTETDRINDTNLASEIQRVRKTRIKQEFTTRIISERNHKTDGNIHKGPRK
jgi:hypothetical protein